eukprot:1186721-Prorocentrum_minimum.AAC.1
MAIPSHERGSLIARAVISPTERWRLAAQDASISSISTSMELSMAADETTLNTNSLMPGIVGP